MNKLIDCITFFNENMMFDFRYNVLKDYVDCFVICESAYDHKGNKKKLNFNFEKNFDKSKIKYLALEDSFPIKTNEWQKQAIQREYILKNLNFVDDNDYIFFSDPDEIPNPKTLKNFKLNKRYGIFMQKSFCYKFNIFNSHETPWEGTRVCKKKNLNSIDHMRQKVKSKNLKYPFFRFDKEKSIEIFKDSGWHFNNILNSKNISLKLKSFAHKEFSKEKFSSPEVIEQKINKRIDLFERGHKYESIKIDQSFPDYLIRNANQFKDFIDN